MTAYLEAYRRGDYAAALQATERIRESGIIPSYWSLRGGTLTQLGQLKDAETAIRNSLALKLQKPFDSLSRKAFELATGKKETRLLALSQSMLGTVYLEQGRYGKAVECFEESLRTWPGHSPFHAHLAEAMLRQGDPKAEALKWATVAVEEARTEEPVSPRMGHSNLSGSLATLAWAVAATSKDRARIDALADEALKQAAAAQSVPASAQVHFQLGLAYELLGDEERSGRCFGGAARIDPQGRWGRAGRDKGAGFTR